MIGGATRDFVGAVDLFGDDEAGEDVGKDELAEGPDEVRAVARVLVYAEGAADDDVDFAGIDELFLEQGGEVGRGKLLTAFVGDNDKGFSRELPFFQNFAELVLLEESKTHVVGFTDFFHVVFDEPFIFAPKFFAATIYMYHICLQF